MSRRLRMVAVLGAALAALGVVVLPVTGRMPGNVAEAADTSQFKAGNIITDQLFFDGSAMSAGAVQTFLNVRNPNCVAGAMPCLKNYRQTTPTRAGSSTCPGTYTGAANETAATIITKIGQACGISQRVLLVILQKEEGLVTASGSSLSTTRYRSAMGFGCPDTAACDSTYYGFFNQVYAAASQYRRYAAYPTNYSHRAGMTNNVRYNPSASCGSSPVYIANQATAGLYNYTPYQPNAAALAAGAGSGDYCSAYGNRNFWIYFTNWFGSTQTAGAGDLADLYMSTGGAQGPLGAVTQGVTCGLRNGGCKQGFANGSIYWSPATGARAMLGAVASLWLSTGAENGVLGYPSRSVSTITGGQYATFEHGSIYWSQATGARAMLGPIEALWKSGGAQTGVLGYPTQSVSNLADGGQYARFQHGSIYWSQATGARAIMGPIEALWTSGGAQTGALGYPTGSVSNLADGVGQFATFQNGSIYWSQATGARAMLGPIQDLWLARGSTTGPLGYPTRSVSNLADGGQYATFQNGSVYWSASTGAHSLSGPVRDAWIADGAETSDLGYPTQDLPAAAAGVGQSAHFQHGSIYPSTAGPETLTGAIRDVWAGTGADRGPLGAPTSSNASLPDGVGEFATFTGGSIYRSPDTGTRALVGPIEALWTSRGAEQGALGYPTTSVSTAADGKGQFAHFQHGSVYWSSASGAHVVAGPVQDTWNSTGAERGVLGYPTQDLTTAADGVGQFSRFQGGSIYSAPATGTWVLRGPIETLWTATGAEHGVLGYPTTSVSPTADGTGQYARFEHGSIYWSPATGARAVLGPIETLWKSGGAERGLLGYPTQSVSTLADGGQYARFEHGSIYWSPATGARAMLGPIETLWKGGGAERGVLGYPTSSVSTARDGKGQYATFQHGSIYWSAATGARAMLGAIQDRWVADGAERGRMGYPTQSVSTAADKVGQYAKFQGGVIYWSPATGAREVRGAFLTVWAANGYEHGALGYPTGEPYAVNGGQWQKFQHGYIAQSTATGRAWAVRQ